MNTDASLSTAVSGKRDVYCILVRTSDVLLVAFTDDSVHCNTPTSILYNYARNLLLAEVVEDEMDVLLNYSKALLSLFAWGTEQHIFKTLNLSRLIMTF